MRTNSPVPNIVKFSAPKKYDERCGHSQSNRMIFEDAQSIGIRKQLDILAPTDVNVLITGETGTGKEMVARYIHEHSRRRNACFVAVNCGALPETLIDAELFGHERGAFTGAAVDRRGWFEEARGGTLLLDEIGDLSFALQVKLLRVVQEREIVRLGSRRPIDIDVRLIAATNVDLRLAVEQGRFRQDLYYRLNVANVSIPPLRERPQDIAPLATRFLEQFRAKFARPNLALSAEALDALHAHPWPGNIRELENVIHKAVLCAQGREITADDLSLNVTTAPRAAPKLLATGRKAPPPVSEPVVEEVSGAPSEAEWIASCATETLQQDTGKTGSTLRPISADGFTPPGEVKVGPAPVLQWIKISDLVVDCSYQRPISGKGRLNVNRIARDFSWSFFSPVVVSPIEGGKFAIIDGQHRTTAALLVGLESVPCEIVIAGPAQQAAAFKAINGVTTAISSTAIYSAARVAEEGWAERVAAVCAEAGVQVARYALPKSKMTAGQTSAVRAIERAINRHGEQVVSLALRCITSTRHNAPGRLSARVIAALCDVVSQHKEWLHDEAGLLGAFDAIDLEETDRLSRLDAIKTGHGFSKGLASAIEAQLVRQLSEPPLAKRFLQDRGGDPSRIERISLPG